MTSVAADKRNQEVPHRHRHCDSSYIANNLKKTRIECKKNGGYPNYHTDNLKGHSTFQEGRRMMMLTSFERGLPLWKILRQANSADVRR